MMIQINGVNIYYYQVGQGDPLILLHGNGEDHHIFDPLITKLQPYFTIYAIDSRNHGQSEETTDYHYEIMAADLAAFIQHLKLEAVNIIGFSDGAITALLLALQQPNLINKMALLGVNLQPSDFTNECYQFVQQTYATTQDPLFKMMLEQPNIELASLKQIKIPTLVIGAEHDIYHPALFEQIANTLPNATLKIMPDHQHDSYIVNNDILATDFIAFFQPK